MQDYRKLEVWQRAHELVLKIYPATATFPSDEKFNLTSQVKRAASSIPANIAEGCGRKTNAELGRFLYIVMGSATELDYHLLLAKDLSFLDEKTYHSLVQELTILRKKLNAFIQRVSPD